MFKNLAGAFFASAVTGGIIYLAHQRMFSANRSWQVLLMLLFAAFIIYCAFSVLLNRTSVKITTDLVRKRYSIG